MTPYELERLIDTADKNVNEGKFAPNTIITETYLLVRRLVQHAADVEATRRLSLPSEDRGTE